MRGNAGIYLHLCKMGRITSVYVGFLSFPPIFVCYWQRLSEALLGHRQCAGARHHGSRTTGCSFIEARLPDSLQQQLTNQTLLRSEGKIRLLALWGFWVVGSMHIQGQA